MIDMIYLYGIIDSGDTLDFFDHDWGRRVFSVAESGLGLVVSPADQKMAEMLPGNILAHNAVVNGLLERFTVLPVKFGTILRREDAARDLIRRHGGRFQNQLERFRRKVEMGVKVLWDIERLQSGFRESGMSGDSVPERFLSGSPGQRFLYRRYMEKAPELFIQRQAEQAASRIHRPMALLSEEARLCILRTPALMLSAAYLVDRRKTGAFREEYLRLKKNYSSYNFLMSGPWPPYSFVDIVCLPGGAGDESGA